MKIRETLAIKLFLLLLAILIPAFGLYAAMSISAENERTLNGFLTSAVRLGDVIRRSTRGAMLRNQREAVSEIVETIAEEPGIEGIRIYNKRGETIYYSETSAEMRPVDMQAEACYGCHGKRGEPLAGLPIQQRYRLIDDPGGYRVMGVISPIMNEPACSNAACHAHSPDQKTLGVVDLKMSLAEADAHMKVRKRDLYALAIIIVLAMAAATGLFVYSLIHVPARKLAEGTREIASGNLDFRLNVRSRTELGRLAAYFNRMTAELKTARDEATKWSDTLEHRVEDKTRELEEMQDRMMQVEKMASLGRLSATVAHELNNPLAGILTFARLLSRKIAGSSLPEEERAFALKSLESIAGESGRCGDIVKNMLLFSRQRQVNFKKENLHVVLESSLLLVAHHLEIRAIKVVREFGVENDELCCDANQLKQAFIALFINAAEAMQKGGTLVVATECQDPPMALRLMITDSGHGIPEDSHAAIFEPFFTTKSEGKGVGLGLSVVYGVVRRHGGTISVDSKPGGGTTFKIVLLTDPDSDGVDDDEEVGGRDRSPRHSPETA